MRFDLNVIGMSVGVFSLLITIANAATTGSLDEPSEPGPTKGQCTQSLSSIDTSCEKPNKIALEILEWLTRSGASDNVADMRAKKFFVSQLYSRYVKARGATELFFLPFRGQDFHLAEGVPIKIAQTDLKKNEAKVILIVTFDESFGKKPFDYNSQVITLLMKREADGNYKLFNAFNGSKWLGRDRGVFD